MGRKIVYFFSLGIVVFGSFVQVWLRMIIGTGIGGEISSIKCEIDESMPAQYRGRVDVALNGLPWFGVAVSVLLAFLLVENYRGEQDWDMCFMIPGIIDLLIFIFIKEIPESPRWLIIHGRLKEAEEIMDRKEKLKKSENLEELE